MRWSELIGSEPIVSLEMDRTNPSFVVLGWIETRVDVETNGMSLEFGEENGNKQAINLHP